MATMLRELPTAVGFMGKDRYDELSAETRAWLWFYPLVRTAIHFVLATNEPKVERLTTKLERVKPLVIATSYPNATIAAIADIWEASTEEAAALVEPLYFGGSVESKPVQIPRVDGIFDLVDTGATLEAQQLKIVRRNLGTMVVGAVWNNNA